MGLKAKVINNVCLHEGRKSCKYITPPPSAAIPNKTPSIKVGGVGEAGGVACINLYLIPFIKCEIEGRRFSVLLIITTNTLTELFAYLQTVNIVINSLAY